jgi:EmrB/QacA subfamily drug resistance transporter
VTVTPSERASGAPRARPHYQLTFAVLALGTLAYALLQSLVAPALPNIQQELDASTAGVAWLLTAYLLSASVATPILGRMGDLYGKKRLLVIVLLVLAAGTLVSALADSLAVMVIGRVIQGAAGAIFPLAFGIVRDEFPPGKVATGIALMSAILGVGAGAGIVLAGPITDNLSFHWLFWIPLVAVVLAAVASFVLVPESPVRSPGRIGWLGAILLSGWLVCLLLAFSEAPTWGWAAPKTVGLFVGAAVLLVAWVVAESRARQPLVDMQMMRLPVVWTVNLTALLLGAGMYSSFVLIPEYVELPTSTGFGFGASVTEAGLYMVPSTLAMLVASPVAGRLAGRVGSKTPLVLGSVTTAVAFVLLTVAHSEPWHIYLATTLMGAGIGLAFASLANLIVEAVPPEQVGVATGMNTIMRTVGGSIGGQVAAAILTASVAGGFPSEHGFTLAFSMCAIALVIGVLAALIVPGRGGARALATAD